MFRVSESRERYRVRNEMRRSPGAGHGVTFLQTQHLVKEELRFEVNLDHINFQKQHQKECDSLKQRQEYCHKLEAILGHMRQGFPMLF